MNKRFVLALAVTAMCPSLALAGNGAHPRTPVDWSGAPCMTVIDRSLLDQGNTYELHYGIPYEDTEVTPDEVDDSRTHQFFVFCRDRHLETILPGWITETDLQAAVDKGLGTLDFVDPELDVLVNAPDWADCWARITDDDERRPITFAAAAEPVLWDLSMLAAGTYVIDGYTYEPWYNMWTPHPGVFKLVDDPDPAANGPAAALSFGEQTVEVGDEGEITGCIDAMDGSTMTLSWSNGNINGAPNWEPFATDVAAQTGSFSLPFAPPIEAAGNSVMIRLDISDPMGREWTAYSRAYVAVVESVGSDDGCDSGGGFVSDPCGTDSETGGAIETSSGGGGSSESGPAADGGDDGGAGGCSCTLEADASAPSPWAMLALFALLGVRRKPDARARR